MSVVNKSVAMTTFTSQQGAKTLFEALQSNLCDMLLNTGGLAIGSSSKPKVKVANTIYAFVDGVLLTVASAEYVLSGVVTNAKYNVYVVYVDSEGTVSTAMGTEAATLGAVAFPTIPADTAVIGFVIVHPTGTGDFTGGTTDLDDSTVVPNAVYVNTPFPFNPNTLTL